MQSITRNGRRVCILWGDRYIGPAVVYSRHGESRGTESKQGQFFGFLFVWFLRKILLIRQWWWTPLIPAFWRQRQAGLKLCEFEASVVYGEISRIARIIHKETLFQKSKTNRQASKQTNVYLFCVNWCFVYINVCVLHVCIVCVGTRRRHWIFWNWS